LLRVKNVMTREVFTFGEDTPVAETLDILTQRRIGGAPVVDSEGRVLGIVTNSDIINLLKRQAEAVRKSEKMEEKHEGSPGRESVVLDILSFATLDWFWYLWNRRYVENEFRELESEMLSGITVKEIMTSKVVTVREDEPLSVVPRLMNRYSINRIPVVDVKNHLKGIVARADIVRALGEQLGRVSRK
jgi:CBS domain-containing protein